MIREALGSAYRKTIGAVKDAVLGFVSSITRGGGLIQALYVILLVALMAGFVDAVVFPVANQSYIPYPSGSAMTIPEAITAMGTARMLYPTASQRFCRIRRSALRE